MRGRMDASVALTVVAIVAALYACWTLYGAGSQATLWGAALVLVGLPIHLLMKRVAVAAAPE